jgi:hypothetical protein
VRVGVAAEEKLEVVDQVLSRIADEGLVPILIFDDTDRWIPGAGYEDPTRTVEAFFGRVIRWVCDLGFAVVVAVHSRYFDGAVPRAQLLDALDTPIDLPRLPDENALVQLLDRRLAYVCELSDQDRRPLEDAFDGEAVAALHNWYASEEQTIRNVVQVAHIATIEAADAGLPRVTAAGVNAAVAAEYA